MGKRSPILGYNHNIRHRGLVFHVQTEDSGVDNPHIFTHLFHGGVILQTRKLVYDAESDEEVVKSLMQAQHKAMLKDLKGGRFAEKIETYFGEDPDLQPYDPGEAERERVQTQPFRPIDPSEMQHVGNAPTVEVQKREAEIAASAPPSTRPSGKTTAPAKRATPPPPPPQQAKADTGYAQHRRRGNRPSPSPARKPGGVVVSRPAVIVGAPPQVVGGGNKGKEGEARSSAPQARAQQQRSSKSHRVRKATEKAPESLFGQGLISEKSLDEVILAYLSDDSSEE